jgi:low affinity Fe/Cu permease
MTLNITENIRKIMGWCPSATPAKYKSFKHVDFVNPSQTPSGESNVETFESKNVMFYANTSVLTFCFIICLNLILIPGKNLDYAVLIPILVLMYSLLYFVEVKMLQANILIDENGVVLKSLLLRDVTLNYRDIKSVAKVSLTNSSIALMVMLTVLVVVLAYLVISGEWKVVVSTALILPWCLLVIQKYNREKHDMDTQLYIEYRYKKWYEISPYYSVITDRMTASGIEATIEHYKGKK